MKKTLAIFSPNQNAYSETFIRAHKNLNFNIRFYFGGWVPNKLENAPSLLHFNYLQRIKKKIWKKFTLDEYMLIYSLKRENVDCILAEYGPTACASIRVIRYLKLPLVVHFHGYDASIRFILEENANKYKEIFSYASSIVVVSEKMKVQLVHVGCPIEKIVVTCCAPSSEFFDVCPLYDNLQFIAVGRFVEKKAPYLTIAAFKKVVAVQSDAQLVMIGSGELETICKNLVQALDLTENIKFTGVLSPAEIRNVMENSVAFVQHSVVADNGDSEGTPVAVLEAQAASLPVISTFHAGIPEVVLNNQTGLLTDELDVKGMADNMIRILSEKDLASKLGKAGRERVAAHFTMANHLGILQKVIEQAMAKKSV